MARRILHCIPTLEGGGAERQLSYLAPELVRLGWDVHVAYIRPGANLDRLNQSGVTLHQLKRLGAYDPRLLWDMGRLIRQIKPSLIQTWLLQMDVVGGLAARFAHLPWILSERSAPAHYPPSIKRRLHLLFGTTADAVVSNSTCGHQYWVEHAGVGQRQVMIPNGVPFTEIEGKLSQVCDEISLPPHDHLLIYVGRLTPGKNVEQLLASLRELPSRRQWHAVFCGTGPQRATLDRLVQEYGLAGRVSFLGYVSTVWQWLRRADLFVSLSKYEGHPNSVIEAMACGCPIVASDIPSHRDCLGSDGGLLVSDLAAASVARAIEYALDSPGDMGSRVRCARERVQHWSLPGIARQYQQLYLEMLTCTGLRAT